MFECLCQRVKLDTKINTVFSMLRACQARGQINFVLAYFIGHLTKVLHVKVFCYRSILGDGDYKQICCLIRLYKCDFLSD